MKFSEVIGQQALAARLKQLVDENRLPHALMLCGPEGCGKKALALALASYLLGEREENFDADDFMRVETQEDIVRKNNCAMLRKWEHPDLHFTYPIVKPAGTSADYPMLSEEYIKEWRELLLESPYFSFDEWLERMHTENQQARIFVSESDSLMHKLSLKSSQGGYKVNLIWLPEYMKDDCANKMLKLLEEPPQQTIFILVSEHPERLLETIRSRVQRIDVKQLTVDDICTTLQQQRGIEADTARRIARMAGGNWLKAVEMLSGESETLEYFEEFKTIMRLAYQRRVKELRLWSEHIQKDYGRERQRSMLDYFRRLVRENFVFNFEQPELNYMTQEEENFAKNFARFINEANVIDMDLLFEKAQRDIAQNTTAKIVLFDMALQLIVLLIRK